jgi:hypothetical protein
VLVPVLVAIILLTVLGPENHGVRFGREPEREPAFAGSDRFSRAPAVEPADRMRT